MSWLSTVPRCTLMALAPVITDQITPFYDELEYAVSNKNRMLAVIQRSSKEALPVEYLNG